MEYTEHTERECGCSTKTGRSGNPYIVYCPKHKAAPAMYEALKNVFKYTCGRQDGISKRLRLVAEQALAQARRE